MGLDGASETQRFPNEHVLKSQAGMGLGQFRTLLGLSLSRPDCSACNSPACHFSGFQQQISHRLVLTWQYHATDEDHMPGVLAVVLELVFQHAPHHSLLKENAQGRQLPWGDNGKVDPSLGNQSEREDHTNWSPASTGKRLSLFIFLMSKAVNHGSPIPW